MQLLAENGLRLDVNGYAELDYAEDADPIP